MTRKFELYIFLTISILLTISCNTESNKLKTMTLNEMIPDFSKGSDKLKKLRCDLSQNYIYDNKDTFYISIDTQIMPLDKDSLMFIINDTAYTTDILLKITESTPIKFTNKIRSIKMRDNTLFYLDEFHGIKIFNKKTKELSKISLKNKKYRSDYGNFIDLCLINDNIITTTPILAFNGKEKILIARKVDIEGNILSYFKIPSEKVDSNWNKVIDFTFCTNYENMIYFTFALSRKIYRYNIDGLFKSQYNFIVDDEIWSPPISNDNPLKPRNTIISKQSLQIKNNMIYHIVNRNSEKDPILIKYNLELVPKDLYELDLKRSKSGYRLFFTENNLIIQSEGIYIYKMKSF